MSRSICAKVSPTLRQAWAFRLSAENKAWLWIPPGFAHGFLVLSEHAEVLYKTTDYWYPEFERTLCLERSRLEHRLAARREPLLSAKDKARSDIAR